MELGLEEADELLVPVDEDPDAAMIVRNRSARRQLDAIPGGPRLHQLACRPPVDDLRSCEGHDIGCCSQRSWRSWPYAFYVPFDHWTYLRFLLPAIPVLLILASACATRAIAAASSAPAKVCALAVVGVVALTSWQEARIRGAFQNHVSVERFVTIPRFARTELPERAIFLTRLYSGSMREYGERLTVRWDVLDPQWLDRAIEDLQARQYVVFIVIEADEEKQLFRDRFGATSKWGALDWPPAAEYRGVETVWLRRARLGAIAGSRAQSPHSSLTRLSRSC